MNKKQKNILKGIQSIIHKNNYLSLNILENSIPIWWTHLVMIYFKRLFCNNKNPDACPLRKSNKTKDRIGSMCSPTSGFEGGVKYIIIEGPDRSGKSTISDVLKDSGYSICHSTYHPKITDLFSYYELIISNASTPTVFDRTFISEIAYGKALRGKSRINEDQLQKLVSIAKSKNYIVIYLSDDINNLSKRLHDSNTHTKVLENLESLLENYSRILSRIEEDIPVFRLNLKDLNKEDLFNSLEKIINHG